MSKQLEFRLYDSGEGPPVMETITIDPADVASVFPSDRTPKGGTAKPVAVLTMKDGTRHVVYDFSRDVWTTIDRAKGKVAL